MQWRHTPRSANKSTDCVCFKCHGRHLTQNRTSNRVLRTSQCLGLIGQTTRSLLTVCHRQILLGTANRQHTCLSPDGWRRRQCVLQGLNRNTFQQECWQRVKAVVVHDISEVFAHHVSQTVHTFAVGKCGLARLLSSNVRHGKDICSSLPSLEAMGSVIKQLHQLLVAERSRRYTIWPTHQVSNFLGDAPFICEMLVGRCCSFQCLPLNIQTKTRTPSWIRTDLN